MPEIILGPPGTGKTTTLIGQVEEELNRGTRPDHIAYLSFTRRAADEAANRACKKFNLSRDDLPYFRTLHSLCFHALNMRRGDVFEGDKVQEWARYAGVSVTGHFSEDGLMTGYETGDRILFIDNLARVRCLPLREQYAEDPDNSFTWSFLETAVSSLRKFKEANALRDYTDMLESFLESNVKIPVDVLVIDEAQDLSALQWRVVSKLAVSARRVIIAGDDDQAIYVWAGADSNHLVTMEGDVRVLDQSYRVPRSVQRVADNLAAMIHQRRAKEWAARDDEGKVDRVFAVEELDFDGDDIMVLARNVFVLKQVEFYLRKRGIIYEKNGFSSVKQKYLQAMVHWEKLRAGESITVDEVRGVYALMSTRIGVEHGFKSLPGMSDDDYVTLSYLKSKGGLLVDTIWHEALDRIPTQDKNYMLEARRVGEKFNKRPRVRVSTIHTAKGAEARHVVLMLEVAKRTDREAEIRPDDELRVWYVAVTRAKERLTLVEPQSLSSIRCKWL